MMIAGDWPLRWARQTGRGDLLEGLRFAELDEVSLYRKLKSLGALPTALDHAAYEDGQEANPALQAITEEVARCARGFEPDVVISFGIQIDFLAVLWPRALRLHIETGPFSRNPYPFSLFFDHLGMYGRSIIGRAGKGLRTHAASSDAVALVNVFRSRNALALDTVDPFRATDLGRKFDRLILLPLQVSNYYSFNEQSSYRTQFEYLLDVLAATPPDVGVIVTEYIEWGHILMDYGSGENIPYLQRNFPNLIFHERFRAYASPSQFLAPRVDGVWSVSSNVGYQALLYNRILGSPATSHIGSIAHATTFEGFFREIAAGTPTNNDALLAWLLERYFVPDELLSDGKWLREYLARRINAACDAADPADAFVPIADTDRLIEAWVFNAPKSGATRFAQPLDEARAETRAARRTLDALLQSYSWRVTAPLRHFSGTLRAWRDYFAANSPAQKAATSAH